MTHPNDKVINMGDKRKSQHQSGVIDLYKLNVLNADEIIPKKQPWLWQDYIPLETCTLLAGKGGIGKSQLLMFMASMVSNGSQFEINSNKHSIQKGKVLILSAEDHNAYTIVPRLKAAKANLQNIKIIDSAVNANDGLNERFITLDNDINLLQSTINEIDDVRLIIIDPITAYIGNIKENRSSEVRAFILKLNRLAERNNLAIILNTHTRKSSGSGDGPTSAADEIMGSSAWANTVRSSFSVSKDPENEDSFLFISSKTNYKKPEGLSYKIESFDLIEGEESIVTSNIQWKNCKVDITADEAVNIKSYENKLAIDEAKEFILDQLKFGNKEYKIILAQAFDEGITATTLKRARQALSKEGTPIIMDSSNLDARKRIWYIGNVKI